jgi:Ca2+-binding EF-hand superfamily protein
VQDLVLLLNEPIFLRIQLEVDGLPYRQPWLKTIAAMHSAADRNADGLLTPDEVAATLASDETPVAARRLLQEATLWSFDLSPVDERLSLEELVFASETRFGGAFQGAPPENPLAVQTADVQFMNSSGRAPGEVLFETLDADRNDRLTAGEVEAGDESLRRLDFDADGNASLSEMEYTRNPFVGQTQFGATGANVPVLIIDRSLPLTSAVDQLLAKYGAASETPRGERRLEIDELAIPQDVLAGYDEDSNGTLDRREVRALLEDPPVSLTLLVRVGERDPDRPTVEVLSTADWNTVVARENNSGVVSLLVEGSQIEVLAGQSTTTQFADYFQSIFTAFDRDANAYLEPSEVQANPPYDTMFDLFDINHDGMLYADEMQSVVSAESATALSRSRLISSNRGRDFFEILDENRDRRISPRELLAVVTRIDIWDGNDDAAISQGEIPQLYQLTFDRGQPDFASTFGFGSYVVTPAPTGPAPVTPQGPVWFQRMDRNDDGDVSRREFLGTREQFESLDADGDELISPQEAMP